MNSSLRFLLTSSRDDWAAPILSSSRFLGEPSPASRLDGSLWESLCCFWGCPADASRSLAFSLCLAASGSSPWRCVWPPVASYGLRSRCPLCLLVICAAEREFRARACGAVLVRKEGWRRVENARIALSTRLVFVPSTQRAILSSSLRYPHCAASAINLHHQHSSTAAFVSREPYAARKHAAVRPRVAAEIPERAHRCIATRHRAEPRRQ